MVVVGIIGLLAAMGLPSIFKALQKEGMRKAVSDVEDVFFTAREQAIVYNKPVAVTFYPPNRRFEVGGGLAVATAATLPPVAARTVINTHSGKTVVATLPNGVELYALGIFRKDFTQSEWAKIYFNPDGTCDEAILVLVGKGGDGTRTNNARVRDGHAGDFNVR